MKSPTPTLSRRPLRLLPGLALSALLLGGCGGDQGEEPGGAAAASPSPVLVEARDDARADADQVEVEEGGTETEADATTEEVETRVVEEWTDEGVVAERVDEEDTVIDAEEAGSEVQLRSEVGIVAVTGTGVAPTATLRRESGGSLGLVGPPARELLRLSGARVRVEGRQANTPTGPGLTVERYEILEIGDRVPEVGILRTLDGATWEMEREGEDPLVLEALPTRGMQEGMKIWVVGQEVAPGRLLVESHGVIAPAR